jgi:hypothetical protein
MMPLNVITSMDLGMAMAAYRGVLAGKLAAANSFWAPINDPTLASFPLICGDPQLLQLFLDKWCAACDELRGIPSVRRLTTHVYCTAGFSCKRAFVKVDHNALGHLKSRTCKIVL